MTLAMDAVLSVDFRNKLFRVMLLKGISEKTKAKWCGQLPLDLCVCCVERLANGEVVHVAELLNSVLN